MKRLLLSTAVIALIVAAALSRPTAAPPQVIQTKSEDRNPWTHLRLNKDPEQFHFAVVSDRTGGARPGVFERAIKHLNLLQPEFVVSVGDLIQGADDPDKVDERWQEMDGFIKQLQMPFFFLPGNHDMTDAVMEKKWREKFGRSYYHFVYQNVLFLMLNTEEAPKRLLGTFSKEQVDYVKRTLSDNKSVRWTIVVMHKPIWASSAEGTGWPEVEQALADRPYTCFCGHIHRYKKTVNHGRRYFIFATTGGRSLLRGVEHGEFDHLVWVTMKKDGPVLANLLLDGIYDEDLTTPPKPPATGKENPR